MAKHLYENKGAEQEANRIAERFMDSSDVIGDMSREFGHDFSSVRIHTDEAAAQRVEGTGADAFASGKDVFFGRGVWKEQDPASKGLLAHELAHTMQQSGDGGVQESVPQGAQQGGILDWFRSKFGRRRRGEDMQISAPLSVARDTSPESQAYMDAMRRATMTADQVPNRMPQANPGAIGSQEALANMREMFGDSTRGTIASSNSVLQEQGRSGALVNLQIRNSKSDEAKADAAYRGTLLGDHREKMVEYMHNLENGGMDFRNVMGGTVKQQLPGSPGAFVSGGRIDQIEQDYLNLFAQYATSDQGIEYLKNTTGIVGQADVFGGDQQEALNYMLQCMLTSAGASYQGVALASDTFEHGQEAKTIASEACRTLLMLPTLSRLGPDAMAELPAPIQTLVGQYMNLVRQIQDKMAA